MEVLQFYKDVIPRSYLAALETFISSFRLYATLNITAILKRNSVSIKNEQMIR